MANEPTPDVDVEAQWYEELGGLLIVAGDQSRRFAGLLRVARGALQPADFEGEREQFRRTIYRIGHIIRAEQQRTGGGVT